MDEAKREVWGIVTAEAPDKEFEVCDYEKTVPYYKAVIEEMSKATGGENYFPLRYMHQLDAIGKCLGFDSRDAEKEIFMGIQGRRRPEWKLVMEKVLTGFSHVGQLWRHHGERPDIRGMYALCRKSFGGFAGG